MKNSKILAFEIVLNNQYFKIAKNWYIYIFFFFEKFEIDNLKKIFFLNKKNPC